jgi:putative ABC transport system permease protein
LTPRRLLNRLLGLFQAGRLDRELDDEVRAHLELAERDAIAAGLPPAEARRAARLRFGHVDGMKEAHRDQRSVRWIEHLARDFRYAVASLYRTPGFTAITVAVLALGIGANAAMFSVVDAVLLKPLPFPAAENIVRIWEAPRAGVTNATSTLDFLDWQRLATSFEALAAENPVSAAWTGRGDPLRLAGSRVTSGYFRVFTTAAHLGRTFAPGDDRPESPPVVVISHATWQTHFGADPQILGRAMVLDGITRDIVGVLPRGAFDTDGSAFWIPLVFQPDQQRRDWHWLSVTGRLRPGVTLARARDEMNSIDVTLGEVSPIWKRDWKIVVERLDQLRVGVTLRRSVLVAFGAVVMVLLIACVNVTNLLLARGVSRQKEMALRTALGASRRRLVAQLITEGLVLCTLGGVAGLLVAALLLKAATPMLGDLVPFGSRVALDLRVLAFTGIAALGVTLVVGTLPAITLRIGDLSQALARTGRGVAGARGRVRRVFVTAQVALSLVLVCGAALLFKSLLNLRAIEPGVRIDHVITMSVDLPRGSYPRPEAMAGFYERAIEAVASVPGVLRVAAASHLPLQRIGAGEGLFVPGVDAPLNVRLKRVDAGYFDALDIPVLAGRGITDRDRAGSPPVIIVNETLVRALREAGVSNPIGSSARLTLPEGALQVEIAGAIRSERVAPPGRPDPRVVYVPLAQAPTSDVKLVVRTHLEPASVMPAIREAVRRVDANLPLGDVATMEQVRDGTLTFASRPAWVIGSFAAVAALLAALGVYGVMAHTVTERRREIGIRMAMGARPQNVVRQVLRNALSMVFGGLVAGTVAAYAVTGAMETLLFEVKPLDPAALVVACVSMTVVGVLAALVPATRAAAVQPVSVLRDEG